MNDRELAQWMQQANFEPDGYGGWKKGRRGQTQMKTQNQKRIRQSITRLNKLEQEFYDLIRNKYPDLPVRAQAVSWLLAPGVRYTPDFYCACWPDLASDGKE